MRQRFRLYRRKKGGRYYIQDEVSGKQESLGTTDRATALRLLHSRNEAEQQPAVNLQIARAYLAASDPLIATRSWQNVMDEIPKLKHGNTRSRWLTAIKDEALDSIRDLVVLETRAEHFLRVLESGSVSTNSYLRRIHSFALDMNWLPWPVLPRKRWPVIHFKEKRAITWEEHQKILAGEHNPEWRAYYEILWHLGGSQTDMAKLMAEDIDWTTRAISYARVKTNSLALIRFDDVVEAILKSRPASGYLFPQIARWRHSDRAKAFIRRCKLVGVSGVSLHSYRYAWAERAKQAGYPERFAQEALGHSSKAVHRAYARKAQVELPSLGEYERRRAEFAQVKEPVAQAVIAQAAL
jgi:integrase